MSLVLIQLDDQFLLVIGDDDTAFAREEFRSGNLVIIAMFTQTGPLWHHDDGCSNFHGSDDRSRPSVGYDKTCGSNAFAKFRRSQKLDGFDVLRLVVGFPDLGKYVGSPTNTGPFVDRSNETIEGVHTSDGDEYQST